MGTLLVGLLGCVALVGCATATTLDDTRMKAPDRVVTDVLDYPFERVYASARLACLDLDLTIEKEDPVEGKIYAKSAPNLAKVAIYRTGFGESVGVYVTSLDPQRTQVEVATQKSNRLEVGYRDYRKAIAKLIRARLEGLP